MTDINLKVQKLDRLIYGFVVLFIITLNNSIFFCQIGFFGAYILIGMRYYLAKENPITKSGLEIPFLLFYSALFISALMSPNSSQAFIRLGKSMLLVPIIYMMINVSNTKEKSKSLINFYLYAALVTLLVYMAFSLRHYFFNLYQLENKGPSPFQYVMTAGGLMSFTAIFFFAFLINEKTDWKVKLLYLVSFGLSFSAVIASYTRAAWLGMFVGILAVLIIKKKWIYLFPAIVFVVLYLIFSKNESNLDSYWLEDGKLKNVSNVSTEGRASCVVAFGKDSLLIADYEKGIKVFQNNKIVKSIATPSPAAVIKKWNDSTFVAFLIDMRFIVLKLDKEKNIIEREHFISPGRTFGFTCYQNSFYVADKDSGLTDYINANNTKMLKRHNNQKELVAFDINDELFCGYYEKQAALKVFSHDSSGAFYLLDTLNYNTSVRKVFLVKNSILFQTDKYLEHYKVINKKIVKIEDLNIRGIVDYKHVDSTLYALTADGNLLYSIINNPDKIKFDTLTIFHKKVSSFDICGNNIYLTSFKRNRVSSIFDPYHETNFERFNIWRVGLRIFKAHPLFGVGDIDLAEVYNQYKDKYLKENFGHLHNNFIHWLAIVGIVGFSIIIFLLIKIFLIHRKIYKKVKNEPIFGSFAVGALASFFGFLASGLGEYNFGDQEIITVIWFILGLNLAIYFNYQAENKGVTNE